MNDSSFQIHTLAGIRRAKGIGQNRLEISGFDSPEALALLLTSSAESAYASSNVPESHVLVFATDEEAHRFARSVYFFSKEHTTIHLPAFDVSPYSGLYPNPRVVAERVGWLKQVSEKTPFRFYTASVESISQRTIPREDRLKHSLKFRKTHDLPETFSEQLVQMGYSSTPLVEDVGSFAVRGSVVDVFSPAHARPLRFDLFGDTIESIRTFNPADQRSDDNELAEAHIIPAKEFVLTDDSRERAAASFRKSMEEREALGHNVDPNERSSILHSLAQGTFFPGLDFLISDFHSSFETPLDHVHPDHTVWIINPIETSRAADRLEEDTKREFLQSTGFAIAPRPESLYRKLENWSFDEIKATVTVSRLAVDKLDGPDAVSDGATSSQPRSDVFQEHESQFRFSVVELKFAAPTPQTPAGSEVLARLDTWKKNQESVIVATGTSAQAQRLKALLERGEWAAEILGEADYDWSHARERQALFESAEARGLISIVPRALDGSFRVAEEKLVFLRDDDFFGRKNRRRDRVQTQNSDTFKDVAAALSFSDLESGDRIVHIQHGIGVYEGLKRMQVNGVEAEFLTLAYKDGDKLYLPIYRIAQVQKYSGPGGQALIDKLGGTGWAKTKIKVRNQLRELAGDLLELYAKRAQSIRAPFPHDEKANDEFAQFEASFPYDETNDQLKAISSLLNDMTHEKPMDRLICGDVGFGKTEVAMRAAFKAIQARKQVAVLAPTTVLSFQHLETFTKRFKDWPVTIRALNRFVSAAEQKKTLTELKDGKIDILIGTHRVFSKDVVFSDLGLLIIDEEQRFGVGHKEKIRKLKVGVDTLTLSATPIPRTLNMSLVGIRDLSLINTAPVDRLPTRTFVCKYDDETIRRGIQSEIQRGGQVFFLHNRVQSIYGVADKLRELVPDARIRIGHGQMDEQELEATMIAFFNHEIDVLLSTTIIESGIDNPRANTMFIDNAHQLGLSQLYQLRGRVGRSKERAYCYLVIPQNKRIEKDAQERLKVIQENTALGSGITIAHHDLELRGAGNLLGEDQSGHIEAVGYEMYLELLEQTIAELKGEEVVESVEPDINVRIQALIPDSYMPDIRIRLAWYRNLANINEPEDIDRIEEQMSDQFGTPPEPVINLMGLMLIRALCRKLGVRDLSSGPKAISLAFTPQTPLPPAEIVQLAAREKGRISLTPDMRVNIRLEQITWPKIYDELLQLEKLCPT
ncbi:MAG: transcription-repair coupling factor [Bdellovibrionales bacterium]|jgi:transcription-repair coupling factor (superfamily II helicase)|nr:transcription-repair coupling factor [Bdellovibrionales bacterium]